MSAIWVSIGSGNGLSPVRRQAITWTNTDLLSIRLLGTNFSETWFEIQNFSYTKMHLKMSSAKWRPFCILWGIAETHRVKDSAHLSTFKFFIFEKFSCFIVLVVFLVIVQSPELISVWFCEKMTFFFLNFISYHIFAIYVGGASLGLPTACRLIMLLQLVGLVCHRPTDFNPSMDK